MRKNETTSALEKGFTTVTLGHRDFFIQMVKDTTLIDD